MEQNKRAFKGVFIPAEIWLNDNLTIYDKAIFAEIDSLDGENHCFASNDYLAEFCQMSKATVTRSISKLVSLGFLEIVSFDGRTRVLKVSSNRLITETTETNLPDYADYSPSENLQYIENKRENNIETPVPPAPPKNHQRLYNEERKTLSDDLESGKEIDNQKKERKRLSVEEKCLAEIDKRDFSVYVKEALREYFDWNYHSSNPKKVKQLLDWRQKLDRLEQLIKKGEDGLKVVNQALENQWYGFFEYKENVKTEKHENFTENIDDWTQEEAQAEYDRKKQLVAEGKLKEY